MTPTHSDWAGRYADRNTPWDLGRAHPALVRWARRAEEGARALVPGCGRGHDALMLAEAGWNVTAIDVVAELEDSLGAALGARGGRLLIEDALAHEGEYELVLEHTFFCALDVAQRAEWGALVRRCLRPGGELVALAFPCDRPAELSGPPHGYGTSDLTAALGEGFTLLEDVPADPPAERRQWEERFVRLVRDLPAG